MATYCSIVLIGLGSLIVLETQPISPLALAISCVGLIGGERA